MTDNTNTAAAPDTVLVWVDGSCLGNPGPGGYAVIKTLSGRKARPILGCCPARTTNNEMELTAILQAVRSLKRPDLPAVIHSDSEYAVLALTQRLSKWRANGWVNAEGKPVAHREIIEAIAAEMEARGPDAPITLKHVPRGENAAADALAKPEAERAKAKLGAAHTGTRFDAQAGAYVPEAA